MFILKPVSVVPPPLDVLFVILDGDLGYSLVVVVFFHIPSVGY
jgi:hypothetical protein